MGNWVGFSIGVGLCTAPWSCSQSRARLQSPPFEGERKCYPKKWAAVLLEEGLHTQWTAVCSSRESDLRVAACSSSSNSSSRSSSRSSRSEDNRAKGVLYASFTCGLDASPIPDPQHPSLCPFVLTDIKAVIVLLLLLLLLLLLCVCAFFSLPSMLKYSEVPKRGGSAGESLHRD